MNYLEYLNLLVILMNIKITFKYSNITNLYFRVVQQVRVIVIEQNLHVVSVEVKKSFYISNYYNQTTFQINF